MPKIAPISVIHPINHQQKQISIDQNHLGKTHLKIMAERIVVTLIIARQLTMK